MTAQATRIQNHIAEVVLREARNSMPVLHLGCGDGKLSREILAGGVPRLVGVDRCGEELLRARAENIAFADRTHFLLGEVSVVNELFAVTLVTGVLPEDVEDLADTLMDDGTLVVSVPTPRSAFQFGYSLEQLVARLDPVFEVQGASFLGDGGRLEADPSTGTTLLVTCRLSA